MKFPMRIKVRSAPGNFALCCALLAASPIRAAEEYHVKAAFLLNFTKFVEWPSDSFASPSSRISICILGDDPFGPVLDQIVEDEAVDEHKLSVERLRDPPPHGTCQVLFVDGRRKDLTQIIDSVEPGVLTVGEGEGFLRDGGIVAFVIDNRRVRFDINQNAASKAGLRLDARLLNVARSVRKNE
jgi:hypothetical protein